MPPRTQLELPSTTPPTSVPSSPPPSSAWGDWRPRGWVGTGRPEDVLTPALEAQAKSRRGEPLEQDEVDAVVNLALLRDCYNTRRWVWQLALHIAQTNGYPEMRGFNCDPFWNPSAQGLASIVEVRLDHSSPEHDGLALCDDGLPRNWRGSCLVNGPHSDPRTWLKAAALHGRQHVVAAVVPCDGTKWYQEIGLAGFHVEVNLGRLNYDPPPGLPPRDASPRGSALLITLPAAKTPFKPTAYAIEAERTRKGPKIVVARPALGRSLGLDADFRPLPFPPVAR